MSDQTLTQLVIFITGSGTTAVIGHAVNTFPTPQNKYGAWFLGCIQFLVGQRIVAKNTLDGMQSSTLPVPNGKH